MSITLALVIAVWYLVLAAGFFAIGWQCAVLILIASTITCVIVYLLDLESREDESCEEDE